METREAKAVSWPPRKWKREAKAVSCPRGQWSTQGKGGVLPARPSLREFERWTAGRELLFHNPEGGLEGVCGGSERGGGRTGRCRGRRDGQEEEEEKDKEEEEDDEEEEEGMGFDVFLFFAGRLCLFLYPASSFFGL